MQLIDTHVHLDALDDAGPGLVAAAMARGVVGVVSIGVDPRRSQRLVGAVPAGLVVRRVLGLHPQEITSAVDVDDAFAALGAALDDAANACDVCAIGETGLDARPDKGNAALHEEVFRRHLRLARTRGFPVVLHCVRRDGRLLDVIDEERGGAPLSGVWHGFTGSADTVRLATKRGLSISIGFQALDERSRRVREAIPHIPDDRLLIETDAPPLLPERIVDVAAAVAALRGTTVEAIATLTTANAARLFGFALPS
jgi:TatD DNase family protein